MDTRVLWSRVLIVLGSITMLGGIVDPLEGSTIILAGSAMLALGTFLERSPRRVVIYWFCVFLLITVGVGALFGLGAAGGLRAGSGRSMRWGLLVLPYPLGWAMGVVGLIHRMLDFSRLRRQGAPV